MEYMTTRAETEPLVYISKAIAAAPMRSTPFCMVSRSDSAAKLRGSQESMAMFAMTLGPPVKPDCAATTSKAPSERMVIRAIHPPSGQP